MSGLESAHDETITDSIKVLVRIRPLIETEKSRNTEHVVTASDEGNKSEVIFGGAEPRHQLRCTFDRVLGPAASQQEIYGHVAECVHQVASGYNSTILAYGQTGSGKVHPVYTS